METTSRSESFDAVRVAWLREIAHGVARLQQADAILVHVERDMCRTCLQAYMILAMRGAADVPAELINDDDWFYRHVRAPGTRIAAKVDDALREGAHRGW